jgi:SAM-dependent methyltransferase
MNRPDLQPEMAAARAYEDFLVPALFEPWASRLASSAGLGPGDRVLDVACGTGVLAREAARRVSPGGSIVGIDPDAGMLAVAAGIASHIDWRRGRAESLPFPDASFDAVVSQFGLMFFADRPAAVREMNRVLAPGGRVAVAVWDAVERIPAYAAEVELVERIGGEPAARALRAPFMLGDPDAVTALFSWAGMSAVGATTIAGVARFPSIRSMVEADVRGWLPLVGLPLSEPQVERILDESEQALGPHVARTDGGIEFVTRAHVVTATRVFRAA